MTNAAHQARTLTTTQFTTALTHAETYTREATLTPLEQALRANARRRGIRREPAATGGNGETGGTGDETAQPGRRQASGRERVGHG
jgi:hypothetical protein